MWFEIIPPYLIITAGIGLPGAALWWIHYLTLGNHYRRSLNTRWDRRAYQRDLRLTGNPYQVSVRLQEFSSLIRSRLLAIGDLQGALVSCVSLLYYKMQK